MGKPFLLITECDLDRCSKLEAFETLKEAQIAKQKFLDFCAAFPCGFKTAYIAAIRDGEVYARYG